MARSANIYTGDGATTNFVVNFVLGFISRDDVVAYVEDELDGGLNQTFRTIVWVNDGLITLSPAPADGKKVSIRRIMDKELLQHDFQDGALLNEESLDESHLHTLFIMHEILDGFYNADSTAPEDTNLTIRGDIDMNGFVVTGHGDPSADLDLINKQYGDANYGGQLVIDATAQAAIATQGAVDSVAAKDLSVTAKDESAGYAAASSTSADESAASAVDVEAAIDTFNLSYRGVSSTDPGTPILGQMYFNDGLGVIPAGMYAYDGTKWNTTGLVAYNKYVTPDGGLVGAEDTFAINYTVGFIRVVINGSELMPSDFVATNGTSVVLVETANVGDDVLIEGHEGAYNVADTYTQATIDGLLAAQLRTKASQATTDTGTNDTEYLTALKLAAAVKTPKVICNWSQVGTQAIKESVGVSSIVDTAVGRTTINYAASFATVDYFATTGCEQATNNIRTNAIGWYPAFKLVDSINLKHTTGSSSTTDSADAVISISGSLA